jgi:hypothetical protein
MIVFLSVQGCELLDKIWVSKLFGFWKAMVVGIPLVSVLRTVSTDGRYMGLVLLIWTFSTSAVVLIMLPKVLAFYNIYGSQTARRGARHGTRVTGMKDCHPSLNGPGLQMSFPHSTQSFGMDHPSKPSLDNNSELNAIPECSANSDDNKCD